MTLATLFIVIAGGTLQAAPLRSHQMVVDLKYHYDERMPLTRVSGIAVVPSGELYVADALENSIGLFSPTGTLTRVIGREGHGPGEFVRLGRVGVLGDTLWAIDPSQRRIVFFSPLGDHLATIPTEPIENASASSRLLPLFPQAVIRGGLIGWHGFPGRAETQIYVVVPRNGGQPRELVRVDLASRRLILRGQFGISVSDYQPLDDSPLWWSSPDGSRVVVVERTAPSSERNASILITGRSSDGSTLFRSQCEYRPLRVPQRVRTELIEIAARSNAGAFGGSLRQAEAAVRDNLRLPEYYPPVAGVAMGSANSVWLKLRGEGRTHGRWAVLDSSGFMVNDVVGPAGLVVWAAAGDHVSGVAEDPTGSPELVRYRLLPFERVSSDVLTDEGIRLVQCTNRRDS